MRRYLLGSLLLAALALPAGAALEQGATAPDFTAKAALAGKQLTFSLAEARKSGPVVVYFYPSAFTGGCNAQAHAFAESIDKFTAAGAKVVGVSLDSIARLEDFSADPKYCAGKLPVASDADGAIARSYGVDVEPAEPGAKDSRGVEIGHGFAQRLTFVVTSDGKVAATIGGVSPTENVQKTLAAVEQLAKKGG
ncbi:MAG TPA: peroxiredoxin [Thermoanaerobaculia bacterium]|jgi:peroxiredoxin|nr:peroxiredoxin [Thermoanaerobaculia bacterium]